MTHVGKMICLALIVLLPSIAAAPPRKGGRAPDRLVGSLLKAR